MASSAVIQTYNLVKHFRHPLFIWKTRAKALNGLTMNIERGEVFGLLGPNGSGKSTTIKLLLGMLWPTSGEVSVFGRHPNDIRVKEKLGYLPEESHLYRFLTAEETLEFYGRLFKLPRQQRRNRIEALLEITGLKHERRRPVCEFSKGMQRRVGLAQSLINDPELVILDEPTSGMDPLGTREIKNIILQLKEKHKTVLLSSHLLADVEDVCDRISILYGGQVRAEGTVESLLSDEQRTQITAQMDEETIAQVTELIRKNIGAENAVDVSAPMERLESLFLRVVRQAQQQGITTSGADSREGAKLDFFTDSDQGEDLLQQLSHASEPKPEKVTAAAAQEQTQSQPEQTPQVNTSLVNELEKDSSAVIDDLQSSTSEQQKQSPAVDEIQDDSNPDTDLLNKLTK